MLEQYLWCKALYK